MLGLTENFIRLGSQSERRGQRERPMAQAPQVLQLAFGCLAAELPALVPQGAGYWCTPAPQPWASSHWRLLGPAGKWGPESG